jgi:NAD(P)-dependent dehydrogenase (short-subunit alcohol dehydrogenase family)
LSTEQSTGRVAVITGASSEIDEAIARALAVEADVTARDSMLGTAEPIRQELRPAGQAL